MGLIGSSDAFREALSLLRRFSECDATVLVQGETGTGKELAARAIHYLGARRSCPFVPVNCGAVPDSLVESELFGHSRGAFTDAKESQVGLITQAEKGTLFLDEVECLSPKAQVCLLRFLQDQRYRPLGSRQLLRADVRIIAASNRDLGEMVRAGAFREDLMYRLTILSVRMPPLRERGADVVALADHFVGQFGTMYGNGGRALHGDTRRALMDHRWPGNVRELENRVHRGFLLADDGVVRVQIEETNPPDARASAEARLSFPLHLSFRSAKATILCEFERAYLVHALRVHRGNVTLAARSTGKDRRAFGKLMKKHGIDRRVYECASVEDSSL